jgi:hypothetical protein
VRCGGDLTHDAVGAAIGTHKIEERTGCEGRQVFVLALNALGVTTASHAKRCVERGLNRKLVVTGNALMDSHIDAGRGLLHGILGGKHRSDNMIFSFHDASR